MSGKKSRHTSTDVELIRMLGLILREKIQLEIIIPECWTFYFSAPNETRDEVVFVLGSGRCMSPKAPWQAHNTMQQLKLRTSTTRSLETGLWTVKIWIKYPDNNIDRYMHICSSDLARCRRVFNPSWLDMDAEPPAMIDFEKDDKED